MTMQRTFLAGAAIAAVLLALPSLAAGVFFNLTRLGTDNTNNVGDLAISSNLTITGGGVASSSIRSNFSAANSDRFRVFHVLPKFRSSAPVLTSSRVPPGPQINDLDL